jgi:hypothetical protein
VFRSVFWYSRDVAVVQISFEESVLKFVVFTIRVSPPHAPPTKKLTRGPLMIDSEDDCIFLP